MLEQQSVRELLQELGDSSRTLIRQEIQLARAEIQESIEHAKRGSARMAAAFLPALMAAFVASLALVWGLSEVMPQWAAAIVVTLLLLAVAGVLALLGRKQLKQAEPFVPKRTIDTVKEDAKWLKNRMS